MPHFFHLVYRCENNQYFYDDDVYEDKKNMIADDWQKNEWKCGLKIMASSQGWQWKMNFREKRTRIEQFSNIDQLVEMRQAGRKATQITGSDIEHHSNKKNWDLDLDCNRHRWTMPVKIAFSGQEKGGVRPRKMLIAKKNTTIEANNWNLKYKWRGGMWCFLQTRVLSFWFDGTLILSREVVR